MTAGSSPGVPGVGSAVPCVSVVMPALNAARTLSRAVLSAVDQEVDGGVEVLVVDDGSTDATPAIAAGLAAEHPSVHLLPNRGKPGISGARNTALDAARGRYIAFLDADDTYHAGHLAEGVRALEAWPEVNAILHDTEVVEVAAATARPNWFTSHRYPRGLHSRPLGAGYSVIVDNLVEATFRESFIRLQGFIMRREELGEVRFNEGIQRAEDREYAVRLAAEAGMRLAWSDRVAGVYFLYPRSLSQGGTEIELAMARDSVRSMLEMLKGPRRLPPSSLGPSTRRLLRSSIARRSGDAAVACRHLGRPGEALSHLLTSAGFRPRPWHAAELAKLVATLLTGRRPSDA